MFSPSFKLFLFCFVALFTEKALFWLYLWQLKNYHLKRLMAHFTTHQGKRLLLNLQNILLASGILWLALVTLLKEKDTFTTFYVFGLFILNLVLVGLTLKALVSFVLFKSKRPVLTKKSGLLILTILLLGAVFTLIFSSFQENAIFAFLVILFLEPIIISAVILILEPLTIYKRKQILKKAEAKRVSLKGLKVIAITGSYGKTSVKEYVYQILKEKFGEEVIIKTEKHLNAEIGIAQTILNKVNEKTKVFIVEVGAYERGKIKEVCEMVKPNIAVLTGISNQHLATFGSEDNIIQAKFEILNNLENDGTAILNGDSPLIMSNAKVQMTNQVQNPNFKRILCSTKQEADIMAADIMTQKETISFKAFSKTGSSAQFNLRAIGKQTVENILLAIAVAKELTIPLKESAAILNQNKIEEEPIKLVKKTDYDVLLTDYSANLTGVLADLEHLKLWQGKRIIIMPCLIELGKTAKKTHLLIGEKLAQICDLAIITTKDYFKEIKQGATSSKTEIIYLQNPEKILEKIKAVLSLSKDASSEKDNVILIEGRSPRAVIETICEN
ncbi:UDP-N-acetylmuramoyl-tripeptide--D-alanyl-D-alanine ligase [Candidatus Parcubacteria bacterium]|nr:UDP-N-acetylmuramoyl-tripeptide--D-alanyl-D-alanine ligase [Candidatus Parcubacteria bacterium]